MRGANLDAPSLCIVLSKKRTQTLKSEHQNRKLGQTTWLGSNTPVNSHRIDVYSEFRVSEVLNLHGLSFSVANFSVEAQVTLGFTWLQESQDEKLDGFTWHQESNDKI